MEGLCMIKLYHGSNVNIDSIGTCYCLSEKGMTQQQKIEMDYLVDDLTQDIAKMLMQDQQCDIAEALNIVYNSRTYSALENPATGLFYQSAVYLYDLLLEELTAQNQPPTL
jgi:hypothetical protein